MSLSLSEFNINNVFISNDVVKYQINKEGIKFYNGAYYDIYTLPYIRYGLHFVSNGDKLVIDKISDSTMKYIIIPNNSYYKPDNEHLELSLKPINDVTLNLNDNVQYIYVNDNIENLTLTESTNKELILSIPNKNFNITSSDTILNSVSHLILRDYNKEYFNQTILKNFSNAKVINLTINSSEGLFSKYILEDLIAVSNLIPNYHYYLYLMKYNMQDIKETLYLSNYDIYEIDTLADYDDIINNNPKFQLLIKDGKIKFNSSNNGFANDFTIDINTQNIIVYDHYFYYYNTDSTNSDNNRWFKYDLFNGNQEDININSLNVVEINGELIEYSIKAGIITINNHTVELDGYSVNKIFRCYDLIVFLLTNENSLKILTSDLSFNNFYDIVINDYLNDLRFYFYHSLTIEFINTSNKNIRIVFSNYTTKELLMKI